jgi:transcriptional regulator with GAF, ATPase, and Fis domain
MGPLEAAYHYHTTTLAFRRWEVGQALRPEHKPTGAIANKRSLFKEANGSSLFLDEIEDLSPKLRVQLRRVIQELELKRVGDTRTIHVDVSLLAATKRDLVQAIKEGLFREALYSRLNAIPIVLPVLKEGSEDISLLAMYFLMKYAKEANLTIEGLSEELSLSKLVTIKETSPLVR